MARTLQGGGNRSAVLDGAEADDMACRDPQLQRQVLFFDSLGLGFFTLVGIHKGIEFGFTPGICVAIGTITACFGGLIRDISLNHIPHIFHKEIYATACIFGGLLFFLFQKASIHPDIQDGICIAVIFLVRLLAVRYNWRLPGVNRSAKKV